MKNQLFLGSEPKKELMSQIKNKNFIKADGGLWTSTYENDTSEWIDWCIEQDFWTTDYRVKWLLSINPNARILKIDNLLDLKKAYLQYGSNIGGVIKTLDFEKIAGHYDGVWLTSKGQYETRLSHPISLYGWDCECVHWLRWMFDEVVCIGNLKSNII